MKSSLIIILITFAINFAKPSYSEEPPPFLETPEEFVLILRILPNVDWPTLSYVASLSEPEPYVASGNKSYEKIAREKYGVFNDKILKLMKEYNSKLITSDKQPIGAVYLPAGPRWGFGVKAKLRAGSNVSQELIFRSGYAGEKNLNQFFKLNPGIDTILDYLPDDLKITLPYVARVVAFRLKNDLATSRKEIEKKLNRLKGIKDAQIIPCPKMIPSFTEAHLSSIPTEGSFRTSRQLWHYASFFDQNNMISILKKNEALVAVLDTGIPSKSNEPRLYNGIFCKRKLDEISADDQWDRNDEICGGDFTLSWPGPPIDNCTEQKVAYHGTHVAGLLAGILLPAEAREQFQASMKIMPLKVVDRNGRPDLNAIAEALNYADEYGVNIFNMSLEINSSCSNLRSLIQNQKHRLFVVAAGNSLQGDKGVNIDEDCNNVFPAKFSSDYPNVITVAAHDENGKLASFSNWGEKTVDLAAPGVGVESIRPGSTQRLSGTSQAAPLVSLAAAILYSSGVVSPIEIRQLLIISADYDPDLKGKVRSVGRLNAAKALAVLRQDVIRLKTGVLVCGRLQNRDPLQISRLSSPLSFNKVKKIIFNYATKDSEPADLILSSNKKKLPDRLDRFEETLDIFPLEIKQSDGQIRQVLRDDVSELVMSFQ